jgi:hypothetical protein
MDIELTTRGMRRRKVALVIPQRRKRKTPLARRRRLNQLIRELALDCGFDPSDVTLAERGVLHQAAAFLLQVEVSSDALVRGVTVNDDTMIRLASEARRLLTNLRKQAKPEAPPAPPWSPLRARIAAAASGGAHARQAGVAVTTPIADVAPDAPAGPCEDPTREPVNG